MKGKSADYRAFDEIWETLDLEARGSSFEACRTLSVSTQQRETDGPLASLPRISFSPTSPGAAPELKKDRLLGVGGTAIVHLATQHSLEREVAVKLLKDTDSPPEATWKLLQEAWITGRLEHPNIVPVHMLGRDSEGNVLLVMKRIEGVSWRAILHGKNAVPTFGRLHSDPLLWHLETLLSVCHAIEFAHSRNIIHRDIKPDNVMIGSFGEVYVVDWGIALSLEEDARGRLPLAWEARGVAGTPAYMAPEMATGQNRLLNKTTDVYLLGATLYEIVTGGPPHQGDTLFDALFSAFRSELQAHPLDVPEELEAICRKAMSVHQADRYASAKAFRLAVADYLQHRHSRVISGEAARRLETLSALIAPRRSLDSEEKLRVYALFGQCRFGFQEALREWEDNREAIEGQRKLLEAMADHEISNDNLDAASVLLAQLPKSNEALSRRFEDLRARLEKDQEDLEAFEDLRQSLDLSAGVNSRRKVFLLMCAPWIVLSIVFGWLDRRGLYSVGHVEYVAATLSVLALYGVIVYCRRSVLLQNSVNRSLVLTAMVLIAGMLLLGPMAYHDKTPIRQLAAPILVLVFSVTAVLGLTLNWRILALSVVYVLVVPLAIIFPEFAFDIGAYATLLGLFLLELLLKLRPFSFSSSGKA